MTLLNDDPIGRAVYNYHFNSINLPVTVHSDDFDDDIIDTSYFFRNYKKMPPIEKKAMQLCYGSVLDVGACAGTHSVYLSEKGLNVYSLEKSKLCCDVLKDRKLNNIINEDIFHFSGQKFDTILLLMNGSGIAGTLDGLNNLLYRLKTLLDDDGQILIDSSDLIFLYTDEDGSALIDINSGKYYGEMVFQTEYLNLKSKPFEWLYVDSDNLADIASRNQLKIDKIFKGKHFDYLARIIHK